MDYSTAIQLFDELQRTFPGHEIRIEQATSNELRGMTEDEEQELWDALAPTVKSVQERTGGTVIAGFERDGIGNLRADIAPRPPAQNEWTAGPGGDVPDHTVTLFRHWTGAHHLELRIGLGEPLPVPDAAAAQALELDLQTWGDCRALYQHGLDAVANASAGAAENIKELVISSTGPGHYVVSLPQIEDPDPEFRLFYVNVNDMPGDDQPLGVFTTAADAVAAIAVNENPPTPLSAAEVPEAQEAAHLAGLAFPGYQRAISSPADRPHSPNHRAHEAAPDLDNRR